MRVENVFVSHLPLNITTRRNCLRACISVFLSLLKGVKEEMGGDGCSIACEASHLQLSLYHPSMNEKTWGVRAFTYLFIYIVFIYFLSIYLCMCLSMCDLSYVEINDIYIVYIYTHIYIYVYTYVGWHSRSKRAFKETGGESSMLNPERHG